MISSGKYAVMYSSSARPAGRMKGIFLTKRNSESSSGALRLHPLPDVDVARELGSAPSAPGWWEEEEEEEGSRAITAGWFWGGMRHM